MRFSLIPSLESSSVAPTVCMLSFTLSLYMLPPASSTFSHLNLAFLTSSRSHLIINNKCNIIITILFNIVMNPVDTDIVWLQQMDISSTLLSTINLQQLLKIWVSLVVFLHVSVFWPEVPDSAADIWSSIIIIHNSNTLITTTDLQ